MAIQKEKVAWCDDAARALKRALGADMQLIKSEVKAGACELWHYPDGGYIVTRLEVKGQEKELVIVASGVKQGAEKLADWVQLAERYSWTIRIHSNRQGMTKFLERQGFEFLETVYRRVNYGRKFKK